MKNLFNGYVTDLQMWYCIIKIDINTMVLYEEKETQSLQSLQIFFKKIILCETA